MIEQQHSDRCCRLGRTALLLSGLILVWSFVSFEARGSWGLPGRSDSTVRITAETTKPDAEGRQVVTIQLAIEEGWYLFANPAGDIESIRTKVVINGREPLHDVRIVYPAGKLTKYLMLDYESYRVIKPPPAENYFIYQGTVVIKGHVHEAPDDNSPLEVSILIQAWHPLLWYGLLPAKVKLTVK